MVLSDLSFCGELGMNDMSNEIARYLLDLLEFCKVLQTVNNFWLFLARFCFWFEQLLLFGSRLSLACLLKHGYWGRASN